MLFLILTGIYKTFKLNIQIKFDSDRKLNMTIACKRLVIVCNLKSTLKANCYFGSIRAILFLNRDRIILIRQSSWISHPSSDGIVHILWKLEGIF